MNSKATALLGLLALASRSPQIGEPMPQGPPPLGPAGLALDRGGRHLQIADS